MPRRAAHQASTSQAICIPPSLRPLIFPFAVLHVYVKGHFPQEPLTYACTLRHDGESWAGARLHWERCGLRRPRDFSEATFLGLVGRTVRLPPTRWGCRGGGERMHNAKSRAFRARESSSYLLCVYAYAALIMRILLVITYHQVLV